jgi:hypothetical protein
MLIKKYSSKMKRSINRFLLRKLHPVFKVLYHLEEPYLEALREFLSQYGLCPCNTCTTASCHCPEDIKCTGCAGVETLKLHFPTPTRRSERLQEKYHFVPYL